jgi:hypothetical protein
MSANVSKRTERFSMLKPKKKQLTHRSKAKDTFEELERCLASLKASREVFKNKFPQTYASLELRINGHK